MPLNYPNSTLEGLMGLSEKYEKLLRPAALFPDLALATGVAQVLKIANPYLEMQERINAWLPKPNNFAALLEATGYARSISDKLQSLSALARPFAHTELAALRTPLSDWAELRQSVIDMAPIRAVHAQYQSQFAAFSQQLTESFRGGQQLTGFLRANNPALTTGLWSSRLLEWADKFDAAYADFESQPGDYAEGSAVAETTEVSMAGTLKPLSSRLETLEVVTPADVAALRTYLEEVYAALTTAISLAVSRLLRTGHGAAASMLLYAGTLGGFLTLVGLPSVVDFYITKVDTFHHPQHATATKEDLHQLKADVLASIKQLAAEQGQLRTAGRRLRIRAKPTEKATCLGTVEAGQQVVVLGLVGKRAYVSYQDVDQLPVHGWVLKKYLNRCCASGL